MASVRKRKAKLDKTRLAEMRKENGVVEKVADQPAIELNEKNLQSIGDELVRSTVEGFEESLKEQSPAVQKIVRSFGAIIQEFFIGYKQGVDEEIKSFIEASADNLKESTKAITEATAGAITDIADVVTKPGEKKGALAAPESNKAEFPAPNQTEKKGALAPAKDAIARITAEQAQKVSDKLVARDLQTFVKPKEGMAAKSTKFGISVLGDLMGASGRTSKKIEEYDRRESFIQTQKELRGEGVSRKELKGEYKTITEKSQEMQQLENDKKTLINQGYSEETVEKKLGHEAKRGNIAEQLLKVDARLRDEPTTPAEIAPNSIPNIIAEKSQPLLTPTEEEKIEAADQQKETSAAEALKKEDEQAVLIKDIRDLLKQVPDASSKDSVLDIQKSSDVPLLNNEEALSESALKTSSDLKESLKKEDEQVVILKDIRDLLKLQADKPAPAVATEGGLDLPDIPKLGTLKNIASKGKGLLTKAAGFAKSPLGGLAGKALAVGAAGSAIYGGVSELAEGKKVETLGDVVPEGWAKLNPFSWAMKGGAYAGDKINTAYGGASEMLGGSESLGSDIYTGVDKVKGLFGFSNKDQEKEVEDKTSVDLANKKIAAKEPISNALAEKVSALGVKVPPELIKTAITVAKGATGVSASNITNNISTSDSLSVNESLVQPTTNNLSTAESLSVNESLVQPTTNNLSTAESLSIDNTMVQKRVIPQSVATQTAEETPAAIAQEIGKNITINVPAPTVVNGGGSKDKEVVQAPFTTMIHNQDPSVNNYLRSRYA